MELAETGISMMDGSVSLASATYTAGKHYPVFNSVQTKCKGLYSTVDVDVVVHLIRGGNITCKCKAGYAFGAAFDYIVEAGSGALTNVSAIPM